MIECYVTNRRALLANCAQPNAAAALSGISEDADASCALRAAESLIGSISRNLAAGPNWIQIREKDLPARQLYHLVKRALELPNRRGVKILVNTRVDVALAAGAAGVHLPSGSPPPEPWRRLTPVGFRIGVSCHSVEEVRQAQQEGADYVFFGPVFDPISKASERPARGLDALSRAARSVEIPVLALGGITAGNMRACISAGAAGIAGISLYQDRTPE